MKITVEVDCTPEEARRAMGLPDLSPVHEQYVALMQETMEGGIRPDLLEAMVRNWSPMGEAGAAFWRRLFEAGTKSGG